MPKEIRPNEIALTRIYDAPVEAVWSAMVDPGEAAKWWGPRGFTVTNHGKDVRPGGSWAYTMHGPDGVDFSNYSLYLEVEPLRRLVYDHGASEKLPPMFRVTIDFAEVDGRTQMEMSMALATPEAAENMRKYIRKAAGDSNWDRLAEYLEEKATGRTRFVINRSFDAPREVVYDLWTKTEQVSKWLPPTGFTMEFLEADLRPGGRTFYRMSAGNGGTTLYGRAHYLELSPPSRVVYTQQFADETGKVSRHPMAPVWPETMLTTVTFEAEGANRTRVTVTWDVHGAATAEEIAAFGQARGGMTLGWTGSFDKLEGLLGAST